LIAEAGDYWGTMLRYLGDQGGLRIAGQLGYERIKDVATPVTIDPTNAAFTRRSPNIAVEGLVLSVMHLPTGLFAQGHYIVADYGGEIIGAPSGYFGETTVHKKGNHQIFLQGGI
jgi:hypothetical protein